MDGRRALGTSVGCILVMLVGCGSSPVTPEPDASEDAATASCGNGTCEASAGETCVTCEADCGCASSDVCAPSGVCVVTTAEVWVGASSGELICYPPPAGCTVSEPLTPTQRQARAHGDFPALFTNPALASVSFASSNTFEIYGGILNDLAWLRVWRDKGLIVAGSVDPEAYEVAMITASLRTGGTLSPPHGTGKIGMQMGGVTYGPTANDCDPVTQADKMFDPPPSGDATLDLYFGLRKALTAYKAHGGKLDYVVYDNTIWRADPTNLCGAALNLRKRVHGMQRLFSRVREVFPAAQMYVTEAITVYNVVAPDNTPPEYSGNVGGYPFPVQDFTALVALLAESMEPGVQVAGYIMDHGGLGGADLSTYRHPQYIYPDAVITDPSNLWRERDYGRVLGVEKALHAAGLKSGVYMTISPDMTASDPAADFVRRSTTMVREYMALGGKGDIFAFSHWTSIPYVMGQEGTANTIWDMTQRQMHAVRAGPARGLRMVGGVTAIYSDGERFCSYDDFPTVQACYPQVDAANGIRAITQPAFPIGLTHVGNCNDACYDLDGTMPIPGY